jgi:hypothetical protein
MDDLHLVQGAYEFDDVEPQPDDVTPVGNGLLVGPRPGMIDDGLAFVAWEKRYLWGVGQPRSRRENDSAWTLLPRADVARLRDYLTEWLEA